MKYRRNFEIEKYGSAFDSRMRGFNPAYVKWLDFEYYPEVVLDELAKTEYAKTERRISDEINI